MCGIIGYTGFRDAAPVLVEGLSKLEYRGYDSAGIALNTADGIKVYKKEGRLSVLADHLASKPVDGITVGLGHTRWATHGAPSDANSHPHTGRCGKVAIVHNGIIENYMELKAQLQGEGVCFASETDTEVAAQLIEKLYDGQPLATVARAYELLGGSFALGILFSDRPDELYAAKRDNPLIIGLGEKENFIASDIPAVLKYTKRYIVLEDGDMACITPDKVTVFNTKLEAVERPVQTALWDADAAEKGGYAHFMLKEMHEQPHTLRAVLNPRIKNGTPDFTGDGLNIDLISNASRLLLVACGSAMHAGLLGKNAFESIAGIPMDVELASEFRYRNPAISPGTVALIISQSGETADTLAALRMLKERGVPVVAIVNVVASTIAREADHVLYLYAGPEIAVATTKAFSSQAALLLLLAVGAANARGLLSPAQLEEYMEGFALLPVCVEDILANADRLMPSAKEIAKVDDAFFIGRCADYAAITEGSLKLKEISYIHSEAYAAGELKHGTISLITEGTPVIAVATQTAVYEKMASNIREVKARGANVTLICGAGAAAMESFSDHIIRLLPIPDLFLSNAAVVVMQMMAYYAAVERGCDVDKPRNLTKSVTVE
ncbi:MAG: glutamine--fructose-6-phosphate transaminase (isomerizing) [Clostridia bacterium]|nr:glutamine--fructose-6-phosphate transaminase (isomerizing) [Clostridia bacterium]